MLYMNNYNEYSLWIVSQVLAGICGWYFILDDYRKKHCGIEITISSYSIAWKLDVQEMIHELYIVLENLATTNGNPQWLTIV